MLTEAHSRACEHVSVDFGQSTEQSAKSLAPVLLTHCSHHKPKACVAQLRMQCHPTHFSKKSAVASSKMEFLRYLKKKSVKILDDNSWQEKKEKVFWDIKLRFKLKVKYVQIFFPFLEWVGAIWVEWNAIRVEHWATVSRVAWLWVAERSRWTAPWATSRNFHNHDEKKYYSKANLFLQKPGMAMLAIF